MIGSWAMLLGWPAILTATGLAAAVIMRDKARLPLASVALVLPVSLYLAGSPRFNWLGPLGPVLFTLSALALKKAAERLSRGYRWHPPSSVLAGCPSPL